MRIIAYSFLIGLPVVVFGFQKIVRHSSTKLKASFGQSVTKIAEIKTSSQPTTEPRISSATNGLDLEWQAPLRNYPSADTFSFKGTAMEAQYSSDSLLNARVKVYLERYRPETGVILISDLKSGHVLALGERQDTSVTDRPKLAFGSGFPAASLIKILTATAALECDSKYLTDSIPQWGSYHTLYRSQLHLDRPGRQNKISLEMAFAKSVNPAFGLMGLSMGPERLRAQAVRLGFNQSILPAGVAQSRIDFPDSGFSLAEVACGFTKKTTISPWHALEIARGSGDDGKLRACSFISSIKNLATGQQMPIQFESGNGFLSPANLPKLQALMQATVTMGTARKGFHSILKTNQMDKIEAGGKTGSLDGEETPGRFDWFIGYVRLKGEPSQGLAFSIMLIHREYASIHASQLAALLIRDWLTKLEKAHRAELAYRAA